MTPATTTRCVACAAKDDLLRQMADRITAASEVLGRAAERNAELLPWLQHWQAADSHPLFTAGIPIPPSANRLWRYAGGRVLKSREYRAWLDEAAYTMRACSTAHAGMVAIAGPVRIEISIRQGKGWHVARDLDNTIKPILDALVAAGVISGDDTRIVRGIHAELRAAEEGKEAGCTVRVVKNGFGG